MSEQKIKIVQISTVLLDGGDRDVQVFGLGEDGNVYICNSYVHPHHWELYVEKPSATSAEPPDTGNALEDTTAQPDTGGLTIE